MTAAALAAARNEVRTLAPLWGLCTLTVIASTVIAQPDFRAIALLAYGLGSCALGAHAFGHEYSHRTLTLVLAQPIDRHWLLAIKLATSTTFVTLLGVAGYPMILREVDHGPATPAQIAVLVWAVSLVLAPALTLLCRGTLAGAIFSASLPGTIALAGGLIGWYRFGLDEAAIERFQVAFFWCGMPPLLVAAAVAGWRSFIHLEAVEERGREFHLPQWLTPAAAVGPRRQRPLWQLIAKELRLQQMVLAIAGIYVTIAAVVLLRRFLNPAASAEALIPLTFMYVALLALLAGALASAEERQLRTLEPQLLLPIPSSRQWLVKTAVVFAIALTLAVVLPATVMFALESRRMPVAPVTQLALTAIVLASAGLYVSSMTTSGVRAIAVSAPFVAAGMFLVSWSDRLTRGALADVMGCSCYLVSSNAEAYGRIATVILCGAFVALMLRYAYINHGSGDRSPRRIGFQLAVAAAFVAVASLTTTIATYYPA